MAAHSTQLAAAHVTSGALTDVYDVPSGKRTIVKSVVAFNGYAGTNYLQLVGYEGATELFQLRVYMAASGSAGDTQILLPWIVMNDGQKIELAAQHSDIYVVLSGAELTA
jgi:hypothetical protein